MPAGTGLPQPAPLVTGAQEQRALNHLTRPAVLSTTPNVLALLMALRRRWLLGLTLGLVLAPVAAGIAWYMRPITFTARTLLEVKAVSPKLVFEHERSDFSNYQRVQVALVRSRLVLTTALRDPKVDKLDRVHNQEDPLAWLEKEIRADFNMAPEILAISMTGEDTQALPVIVYAVSKAYLAEIVQKENRIRTERLKKLKERYADFDTKLSDKREMLRGMQKRIGHLGEKELGQKQAFNDMYLHQLESELLKLRSELRKAELDLTLEHAKTKAANQAAVDKTALPEALIEKTLKDDAVLKALQKKIADNELLRERFRERSPDPESEGGYRSAGKQIEAATAAIKDRRAKLRPDIVERLRGQMRDDQELKELQLGDAVKFLKLHEHHLEQDIARFGKDIKNFNEDAVDMTWMKDEIAQLDLLTKEFSKQMLALEVEMQAPARVTEMEEAIVLPAQTEANRLRFAGGAGFGAFAVALLGVAFLEFRSRRVSHVDEISQGLKMKLVGSLPLVPRRALLGKASRAQNHQWQNRLMESVDAIRTTLLNAARFDGLRRVMVTSAVGGEGKTLLSCHLAVSLARAGCRTLLIDGDLRRPSVHKIFGMELGKGLSDLLRGEIMPAEAASPGPLASLSVITAGQSDRHAIQLLARERIVEVLQQLGKDYEFIIIDSAPILPVADAQLIGQHVEGVVLSVMRDVSRLPAVYSAYERLAMLRVRILGAVVNGADGSFYRSSYGYGAIPPQGQHAAAADKTPA